MNLHTASTTSPAPTMTLRPAPALACLLVALSITASPAGAAPTATAQVDATIKVMAEAANRTYGKSVVWCDANQRPAGASLDTRLKTYLAAMSSGTREAMQDIAAKNPDFVKDTPVLGKKDQEMMDQQADALLQGVKASPAVCARLAANLDAGTPAFFRDSTRQGYQEYLAKRAEYCARTPKPANCK